MAKSKRGTRTLHHHHEHLQQASALQESSVEDEQDMAPEDTVEVCSTSSLEESIDALYQKGKRQREEGLRRLALALKTRVLAEFAAARHELLLQLCVASLKRGAALEALQACQLISLLAVSEEGIALRAASDAGPQLTKLAKLGENQESRVSAIHALGVINFFGCTPGIDEGWEEAVSVLWQIVGHKSNHHAQQSLGILAPSTEVKAAALAAWSLLLSAVPPVHLIQRHAALALPTLFSAMDGDDQALRAAAGEALALFYDANNHLDAASSSIILDDDEMQRILERIQGLAHEAGGRGGHSRATKKAQRGSFREVLSVIQSQQQERTSWKQIVQLRAITALLGEGLQTHLRDNPLLRRILNGSAALLETENLSVPEKRKLHSPNSMARKDRTQSRNAKRDARLLSVSPAMED